MRFRSLHLISHLAFTALIISLLACHALAQRAGGTIAGRVLTDDGQPVPQATVSFTGAGSSMKQMMAGRRNTTTDDEGNFVADGLDPIPYSVSAWAPGYVLAPESRALTPFESTETRYTRIGESITLTLVRGGVITGRVTSATGEPVIGVVVQATRIRDENGRPVTNPVFDYQMPRTTDDRGIYRIYGLAPGSYLVSAGGRNSSSNRPSPFAGRMLTYYPSSTRDAATPVQISNGAEATGIDISYRGERGFSISGRISGAPKSKPGEMETATMIQLRNPATGETIATTYFLPSIDQAGYAFHGVPNGEYEAVAQTVISDEDNGRASAPRRVAVRGGDVAGIDLALTPAASIAGTIAIEKRPAGAQRCESHREYYLEETVVKPRRDELNGRPEQSSPIFGYPNVGVPDSTGAFTIRNLKPGRYRIESNLPDENWYLKTITISGAAPAQDPRAGLTVKSGEKLAGLQLTIAQGGASFKGKVAPAENAKLPPRMRVHLIPVEPEARENVLKFAETRATDDGYFIFTNLAPGKYFVLARAISDSEPDDRPSRPAAWEVAERTRLRKEAEMVNAVIELTPCQRAVDYTVRFAR